MALKQQELAQQRDISEKQISAGTGFQKEAVDSITQDYVRQGLPLVVAKARATRDVMTAGANPYAAGSPLNARIKQLENNIQMLEASKPNDPRLPSMRKQLEDAQAKFNSMGSDSGDLSTANVVDVPWS
jgi:hypothetical protein